MLITNIDLAQRIITRYTSFLSNIASAADLTLLEPPASVQNQENPILQRQEIRHIYNCMEQNTMVSVNLNLQFLNQMVSRAVQQLGKENRHAAQMLQRPMVMDSTTKPGSIRIDAPATQVLLRELRQREIKELLHPFPPAPAAADSAGTLLRRSLTQLATQAAHPVIIEYPAPATGRDAQAATRPLVRSAEPAEAGLAGPKTDSAPTPPSRLHPMPSPLPAEAAAGRPNQISAPPTPLVHPATEAPAQSGTALKVPKLSPGAPTPLVHPAAEVPPIHLPPTVPPLVHPATEAPPRPGTLFQPAGRPQSTEAGRPTPPTTSVPPAAAVPHTNLPSAVPPLVHPDREAPHTSPPPAVPPLVHPDREAPHTSPPPAVPPPVHPATEAQPQLNLPLKAPGLPQHAEAPRPAMPPTPAALVHPAAEMPAQSGPAVKTPALPQRTEAPPPTMPPTRAALVHPAAEALPQPNITLKTPAPRQRTEALPPTVPPTQAALVHPAVAALSQPNRGRIPSTPWQPSAPLGRGQYTAAQPADAPLPTPPNQVSMLHPGPAAVPQESLSAKLSPTHRGTHLYRKGMAPAAVVEPQMESQPAQLSQRSHTPISRVLREEAPPAAQPRYREAYEPEADTLDIPTVRVQKKVTREVRQPAINQQVVINAPQNNPKAAPTEQLTELPEAELLRITNQVYRALETRLRNEKMRRGMW